MAIRRINPPDESWLDRLKLGEPRIFPEWPEIAGVALVVAIRLKATGRSGSTQLYLVTSEQEADAVASTTQGRQLWFIVSRHHLLKDGVVPDLEPGDFHDSTDPDPDPAGGGDPQGTPPDG
jgi:hypothetical protein